MVTVDLISIFIIRFTDIFHDHSRNIITIQSAFSSFLSLSLSLLLLLLLWNAKKIIIIKRRKIKRSVVEFKHVADTHVTSLRNSIPLTVNLSRAFGESNVRDPSRKWHSCPRQITLNQITSKKKKPQVCWFHSTFQSSQAFFDLESDFSNQFSVQGRNS